MPLKEQELTPRQIVAELDRHIVGQKEAKKAVAIALRNRWRRKQLPAGLREEVMPKNILMIGPTGVGKTEIARRLAKLANAPFIKVEATRFTEVGYVGRDVEQIVRDLMEAGILLVREQKRAEVEPQARAAAEMRVVEALVGNGASEATKQAFLEKLRAGLLDDKEVEIELEDTSGASFPMFDVPGQPGTSVGMINLSEMLGRAFGPRMKRKRMKVKDAFEPLMAEESDRLIDEETIVNEARHLVENAGIVFLDEIDKICARAESGVRGGDVSREGVQRDLLPLIEGTTVSTRHGPVKTDHILFIASGAFHVARPSDLLPELQGRLPIRVELAALTKDDFKRILTEPEASLVKQYVALMETEGVKLEFTEDGIEAIARIAADINEHVENIGARRLHTVMERVLEEISFEAPEAAGATITVNARYVEERIGDMARDADLTRYIL